MEPVRDVGCVEVELDSGVGLSLGRVEGLVFYEAILVVVLIEDMVLVGKDLFGQSVDRLSIGLGVLEFIPFVMEDRTVGKCECGCAVFDVEANLVVADVMDGTEMGCILRACEIGREIEERVVVMGVCISDA